MRRHAATVVFVDLEQYSLIDDWSTRIELRCGANGGFSVYGSKFGTEADDGLRSWTELAGMTRPKSPLAVRVEKEQAK